jgi:hypothetical protein
MEVLGKIKMIDTTKEVGTGGFKKRDIVITTDESYPQHILLQFVQDKCDLLNIFNVGDLVKVDVNLKGREWTNAQGETVYFNTIQGWRIFKQDTSKQTPAPQNQSEVNAYQTNTNPQQAGGNEEEADDLPF